MRLSLLLLALTVDSVLLAQDQEELRLHYETRISEQLVSSVSAVIPEDSFSVSTHIRLDTKSLQTPRSKSVTTTQTPKDPPPRVLPGFEDQGVQDAPKGNAVLTAEDFVFDSTTSIERIDVFLVLDESLSARNKDLAVAIAKNKLKTNYGKKAKLEVRESDFIDFVTAETPAPNHWADFVQENFPHLLYAALALMLALLFGFFWLRRARISQEAEADEDDRQQEESASGPNAETPSDHSFAGVKDSNRLLARVIQATKGNDKLMSFFLSCLSVQQRQVVIDLIQASPYRKLFSGLVQELGSDKEEAKVEITITKLAADKLSHNIDDFATVNEMLLEQPFGYLGLVDAGMILTWIGDNPKDISLILNFCDQQHAPEILSALSPALKATILENLHHKEYISSLQSAARDLDERLRAKFLADRKTSISLSRDDQKRILLRLMENDPHIAETVREVRANGNVELDSRLDKFTYTFEDVLKGFSDEFVRILDSLDNESIAFATKTLSREQREQLISNFSKIRRNLIENLWTQAQPSEDEIQRAKKVILNEFRKVG